VERRGPSTALLVVALFAPDWCRQIELATAWGKYDNEIDLGSIFCGDEALKVEAAIDWFVIRTSLVGGAPIVNVSVPDSCILIGFPKSLLVRSELSSPRTSGGTLYLLQLHKNAHKPMCIPTFG